MFFARTGCNVKSEMLKESNIVLFFDIITFLVYIMQGFFTQIHFFEDENNDYFDTKRFQKKYEAKNFTSTRRTFSYVYNNIKIV